MQLDELIKQLQAVYEMHGNASCLIQGGYARGYNQDTPMRIQFEDDRFGSGKTVTIIS